MDRAFPCRRRPWGPALGLLAAAGSGACGSSAPQPEEEPTNVLLITLDTTRADYLGTYGHPGELTPNIDDLAEGGTRFDLAISTASITPVAHAAILTGMDNPGHGLRLMGGPVATRLPDEGASLASLLADRGYHTAAVLSSVTVSRDYGLEQGFEHFDDALPARVAGPRSNDDPPRMADLQRSSEETTDLALAVLEEDQAPFFLWVHYWDPHDGGLRPPDSVAREKRALYAEEVAYMDSQIGRLLDGLETEGLADSTLLCLVADHGEGLGDHGWRGHHLLYQEQIHVPLILSIPGEPQVASVEALVRVTDIAPTVLDYLQLPLPSDMDGRSLRGFLRGERAPPRLAFADQLNGMYPGTRVANARPLDDFLFCAMDREWKLIYRPSNPDQSLLFHIARDAEELHDLYHERPLEAQRLLKALAHHAPWPTDLAPSAARGGLRNDLEALGYAGGDGGEDGQSSVWVWGCPVPEHHRQAPGADGCGQCGTPFVPRAR